MEDLRIRQVFRLPQDEVFDKLHEVWAKGEEKENGEDAACSNNIDMSSLTQPESLCVPLIGIRC